MILNILNCLIFSLHRQVNDKPFLKVVVDSKLHVSESGLSLNWKSIDYE